MKRKFSFVMGLYLILEIVWKLATCANCEDNIFMFQVSAFIKYLFLAILATGCLYPVYVENWAKKEEI